MKVTFLYLIGSVPLKLLAALVDFQISNIEDYFCSAM